MSTPQPWTADRPLDAPVATRAIGEAVPALRDADVRRLGSGWDFDAYEADERWVFRFPRREAEQERVHRDLLVLPWVVDRIDLPAPRHGWGVLRAPSFPYVFSGHEKLHGLLAASLEPTPDLVTALGHRLGGFFRGLHTLEPPEHIVTEARLARPLIDPGPLRDAMRKYLPRFRERVPDLAERATRFFDDAQIVPPQYQGPARLLHGDLHAEHLLLDPADPTSITGTLDWSDARVGDPAREFACIYPWGGEAMLHAMLASYDAADPTLETRSRFIGMCFAFMDWSWWIEIGNGIAEAATLRTLDACLPR